MKNKLITFIASRVLNEIIETVNPGEIKRILDGLIDQIENKIIESESKLDDSIALPVLKLIREVLSIPDND